MQRHVQPTRAFVVAKECVDDGHRPCGLEAVEVARSIAAVIPAVDHRLGSV
ncbi:hypothetical protein MBAV_002663 [Candidatus Magnetobacterium bavaricum]|uniref:Uncharacterized protein n=1 Tax=Candidatus Magnetobacterium bavaricum TaxID=29290 RepID=A0A0F3GWS8_9BACT|nr:hypothetical protein MBAV_002663 [Candidatus Magnetobacterium bavaricum]